MPGKKLVVLLGLRLPACEISLPRHPLGAPSHQLAGDISVVLSCHARPNGRFHQPRQGGEHIDGGVDLGSRREWRGKSSFPSLPYLSPLPLGILIHPMERWAGHTLPSFFLSCFYFPEADACAIKGNTTRPDPLPSFVSQILGLGYAVFCVCAPRQERASGRGHDLSERLTVLKLLIIWTKTRLTFHSYRLHIFLR